MRTERSPWSVWLPGLALVCLAGVAALARTPPEPVLDALAWSTPCYGGRAGAAGPAPRGPSRGRYRLDLDAGAATMASAAFEVR